MANKGAAAAGGGIVTVIVAGTIAFFGGRTGGDNNAPDNNTADNAAIVENVADNGNRGPGPDVDPTPLPMSIDDLIAEVSVMFEGNLQDPPQAPDQRQLQRVFAASPERLATLKTSDISFYRTELYQVLEAMDREDYSHDRAGRYDTSDSDYLKLVKSADGGFRIELD